MPMADAYLEKISNQAIVSHLENRSLWVLVDGNNGLDKKKKNKVSTCTRAAANNYFQSIMLSFN